MIEWLGQIEPLGYKCAIALAWLGCVGLCAMVIHYVTPQGSEFVRKVVHIGTGHVILLAWWLHIPGWVGVGASIFFSLMAILSYRLPLLPSINNIGRRSWGTCFYAISIGILIAYFWPLGLPQYAVLGVLVMTWGDGLAGLIGRQYGRHIYTLGGQQKSWEGTAIMAIVSTIVALAILIPTAGNHWPSWLSATIIGIVAAGLESWSHLGIDNLTVPIGSAAIAYGLMQILA